MTPTEIMLLFISASSTALTAFWCREYYKEKKRPRVYIYVTNTELNLNCEQEELIRDILEAALSHLRDADNAVLEVNKIVGNLR